MVRCGLRAAGRSCGHRRHQSHRGAAGLSDRHTLQGFGSAYIIIKRYTIMKKFFPLFAVIIVLVLAVCSFHIIPTGYTGVKTSFGQIQKTTIQSGKLNFCMLITKPSSRSPLHSRMQISRRSRVKPPLPRQKRISRWQSPMQRRKPRRLPLPQKHRQRHASSCWLQTTS